VGRLDEFRSLRAPRSDRRAAPAQLSLDAAL
jgi:hypothetical protein